MDLCNNTNLRAGFTPIHSEFHTVSSHTYAAGVKVHRATSKTDLPAKELPKEEDDHNDNDDDEASTNDLEVDVSFGKEP